MRVCYLLQTHRDARQIARLVATLGQQSPGSIVLVAHDQTGCALTAQSLPGPAEVHYLPVAGPMRRGYFSLLDPYLQGVAWLRREGLDYDWLVYLSGQDYPVQPLTRSEALLASAECDGFLRYWPALGTGGPWRRRRQGLLRYYFQYRDAPPWSAPWLRLLKGLNGLQSQFHVQLVYGLRVGRRARHTPFDHGRVCYAGWQWTTLRRACAEHVLETVESEPELVAYYRRTICPDESLVQTILVGSGRFRLTNDNLRYSDTGASRDGRPRLLGVADLGMLISGGYCFARKFDLDYDARVLDLLDERLDETEGPRSPGRAPLAEPSEPTQQRAQP
ncbi:MAG TPA: beta-1,6-N-acetylglucosaminyltransferase [Thermoanaerobaculia bacterium]|nr:beta-1,6-N-acetylglucosaminyltransferase [Thermoanaerobaculia bacterium]